MLLYTEYAGGQDDRILSHRLNSATEKLPELSLVIFDGLVVRSVSLAWILHDLSSVRYGGECVGGGSFQVKEAVH